MDLFHTTTVAAGRSIDRFGFQESRAPGSDHGIFFSDRPLGRSDIGPLAAVIFKISLAPGEFERYSCRRVGENDDDEHYSEYLIPTELANATPRGRLSIEGRLAAFEAGEPTVDGRL